jgi:hypothetical protein
MENELSEKLTNSVENRVTESHTGKVRMPKDIIKRVMSELGLTEEYEARDYILQIYNGERR